MPNYTGVDCPVCNKKFAPADDVVVCPICGAPHHRACYMEKGACVYTAEHAAGKVWEAPAREPEPEPQAPPVKACPECGAPNTPEAAFCQICGGNLGTAYGAYYERGAQQPRQQAGYRQDASTFLYGGFSPDETIDGESVQNIISYVGSNPMYFLLRFQAFSKGGSALSPNLGALLFNFFYFFYRKMYAVGAALLAVFILGQIPAFLYAIEYLPQAVQDMGILEPLREMGYNPPTQVNWAAVQRYESIVSIVRVAMFAVGMFVSFFANNLYYRKVIAEVRRIRQQYGEMPMERPLAAMLQLSGGVNPLATALLLAGIFVLLFMVSGAIGLHVMGG